jgi:hypothetical protein
VEDQELRITPAHGSEEHPGTVFGVEIPRFRWVALALLAGLAVLVALAPHTGLLDAAPWAVAPVALIVAFLRFQQGKPPGYALDWLDQLLTGGHARPPLSPPASDDDDSAS